MKTRYKILLVATIGFISFWAFTPTIVLHACAGFDLDWRDVAFCDVNGELIGDYYVLNLHWWTNPVIQLIDKIVNPPSCTYNVNDESLPQCIDFRESFDGGVLENEN